MNWKLLIKVIIYTLLIVIVVLAIWLTIKDYKFYGNEKLPAGLIGTQNSFAEVSQRPDRDWSVEEVKIGAKSAICVEADPLKNKVLFNENEKERLPIASLTKLMAALVVLENYNLDIVTVVSPDAVKQDGKQGLLTEGEMLSVNNLLYIMLIESSNDAAYSLAEIMGVEKFVDLMNLEALKLGLEQSSFKDPTGLSPDNYSTAEDLVGLTEYITKKYPIVWEILSLNNYRLLTPRGELHHQLQNTNELLGKIPDIVGGKTGLTSEAKGCLLLIIKNPISGNNLIYILLGSDDRFNEMQKLVDWINSAYKW